VCSTAGLHGAARRVVSYIDPSAAAEFAAEYLSAENPPEKLRRAKLAAEFC